MQEQNKHMTFSRVLHMASEFGISRRPSIEVHFKDLTLTLKGKHKHILRCVIGTLSPGRVSIVMGPSGARKTTFLFALIGKPTAGCTTTGSILINGKSESIQSYKKVIGYVTQDDIVHENLTVEDNLWFSARCRYTIAEKKTSNLELKRIKKGIKGQELDKLKQDMDLALSLS
ncbi:ABC transporter G family member 28-like [Capsicum annuum]|uniref:ABC transporter G family member 28-like n=1 Tax=Capsicum annuum TaxID=4072 RepID=UPI001FB056B1|nr:ABC transporter G family member 28-like [Capsicum annuum]